MMPKIPDVVLFLGLLAVFAVEFVFGDAAMTNTRGDGLFQVGSQGIVVLWWTVNKGWEVGEGRK